MRSPTSAGIFSQLRVIVGGPDLVMERRSCFRENKIKRYLTFKKANKVARFIYFICSKACKLTGFEFVSLWGKILVKLRGNNEFKFLVLTFFVTVFWKESPLPKRRRSATKYNYFNVIVFLKEYVSFTVKSYRLISHMIFM